MFAPMHWNSISDWVTVEMIIDITNVMSVVVGTNTAIRKDLYSFQFLNYPGKICGTSRPPFCPGITFIPFKVFRDLLNLLKFQMISCLSELEEDGDAELLLFLDRPVNLPPLLRLSLEV